jgi:hypothetical protein
VSLETPLRARATLTFVADDKHFFTLDEVNGELVRLRELFGAVMQLRGQLKGIYQRLDAAGHPPREEDLKDQGEEEDEEEDTGEPPPAEVQRDLARFRGLVETLREQIEAIQDTGCVIKDIEVGLVDWPALHQGREVLLCWKYGEPAVAFWHERNTGFAGRRPVSELDE